MNKKYRRKVKTESRNVLHSLICAVNYKLSKYINKQLNKIKCEHLRYSNIYCNDTGLFMYGECCNCGKKRWWRN